MNQSITHNDMANAIRALAMDAVEKANSGHPGMPMGMADVATVLFTEFLKFNPKDPNWFDRDRFVLSAGHGSMLLYALLYLTGYEDMTLDEIKNFRQLGAKTAGHPEFGHASGIETTTGPLGQGLANAVGMAIAERITNDRLGDDLVDHYTYVIAGDGCLMEGISQEAISLAGHLKLSKLIVLWDDNKISIDGPTSLSTSEDQVARFRACGWDVQEIDGHNPDEISKAIRKAKETNTPSMIACDSTIGFGAPTKAGKSSSHGSPLGADEIAGAREALGWGHEPFVIPEDIITAWRIVSQRCEGEYQKWKADADASPEFRQYVNVDVSGEASKVISALKKQWFDEQPAMATRQSSGKVLEVLTPAVPSMIGGSADLTGSNNTKHDGLAPITPDDFSGRYIYYGIREHGMAAAMNGMALHGGVIPYSGTFLVFTDYCRPSIRLAALMKQRSIFVMTHDSIGLGEDGPTHQPVEHVSSLRAIPDLLVLRPADAIEAAEAWEIALTHAENPSVLALTRQKLPALRINGDENLSAKGGYIISAASNHQDVTIIATGSEVHIAIEAQEKLKAEGIDAAVVSMPCTELFDQQPAQYQQEVIPEDSLKIAVEAAGPQSWYKYIGRDGIFVGMESFGASAPADQLYKHFGITADAIAEKAKQALKTKAAA